MSEPSNVIGSILKRQRVFAVMNKLIALLGLAALGFLLTRTVMTLPIGWIVFVVVVIQLSLSYSPTRDCAANRAPVPVRSRECRHYHYRANGPYPCRKLSRKEN